MPTKQVTSIARKHLTKERHGYICYYKVYVSSVSALLLSSILTLFRTVFFGAAHRWWWGRGWKSSPPENCHTYRTMIRHGTIIPYLMKIQKLYESRDTHLEFCWHQHFLSEIRKVCYIKKYRYGFCLYT